ncbi:hypothetical protein INS49_006578 [Diaporthe citri]|uniref:uncharacterized protein n=1 Tax=Diaporthe citri TaxID=83186 RepID=UPI001C81C13B|nr:uncharacterized protein INS49_006578 [Diaporthe citri]KAG6364973.1 hypothetical protein INS49_006578 [Diaporthe citri]
MLSTTFALAIGANLIAAQSVPSRPSSEPFEIVELPLPPVSSSTDEGSCTSTINPHGTGLPPPTALERVAARASSACTQMMWMSGMRGIPPLIDLVAVTVAASTRNNGVRRLFQPTLIDRHGDRDDYYGQRVNAGGDGSDGAVNDPNWNGRADPAFSLDGTKITYWQALVFSPACGGENPLPCPKSTAQGGRECRVMLARRTDREPTEPAPVYDAGDEIPWAASFPPGSTVPDQFAVAPGEYTVRGRASGFADVSYTADPNTVSGVGRASVNYTDFSDDGGHILDGHEDVTVKILLPDFWTNEVDWVSDIVQTGVVNGTKKTSPGGFHLIIDSEQNYFNATGTTLTTIIDGVEYKQPANGT